MPPGVEDNATPPSLTQSKSKQERIRDNQRRSRARRQEYLADLERRLSECQLTCRDATLKEGALLEVQIENARLRELLALAGVTDTFVDQYVSQAIAQSGQYHQGTNPSLRQLKPRVAGIGSTPLLASSAEPNQVPRSCSSALPFSSHKSAASTNISMSSMTMPLASASTHSALFSAPSMPDPSHPTDFDWLYQPTPSLDSQDSDEDFCCDTFLVPAQGTLRAADDNAILCSVAKQMIEQYHISPTEMKQVKAKLAAGFCKPAYPGAGCAVNNETLFQVLNELSSNYS